LAVVENGAAEKSAPSGARMPRIVAPPRQARLSFASRLTRGELNARRRLHRQREPHSLELRDGQSWRAAFAYWPRDKLMKAFNDMFGISEGGAVEKLKSLIGDAH
jgi:hypothetical protein